MHRKRKLVVMTGAMLSAASLLVFIHLIDRRDARDLRVRSDRIARRLCESLQAVDVYFSRRPALPAAPLGEEPLGQLGLQLVSAPGLSSRQGPEVGASGQDDRAGIPLICARKSPQTPLVMVPAESEVDGLFFGSQAEQASGRPWLRLSGKSLVAEDLQAFRLISVSPWRGMPASRGDRGHRYRIEFGEFLVGLNLVPKPLAQDPLEHSLALVLGMLGILFSGVIAHLSTERNSKGKGLISSFRRDGLTSFLTRYALVQDLKVTSLIKRPPREEAGMLVTIDFRFLQKQNLFLSEVENIAILENACKAISEVLPFDPDLNFYRVSETKIGLIVRASEQAPIDTRVAAELMLSRLLGTVTASIKQSIDIILERDDLIVTGQLFRLDDPRPTLLRMQAFGELLTAEDRRSFRLVEAGDDQLVMEKSRIREQLTCLTASDLELRFQPILLVANPGHFGLELLISFRPPALSRMGTGKVMQLAHDIGIAHQIDGLVLSRLDEVQQALRDSDFLSRRIEYVSINISADSVANDQRLNQLIGLLRRYRIDASTFCIEITEMAATDVLTGADHVTTASERLIKELHFRVFIDDFGSGLSNYRRISEAWYDAIKLDIGLIKGIDRSFRLQRYVGSLVDTFHALGKTVVCEGVETYNEMTAAVRLGVDGLQGFLISHPVTMTDVEAFLRASGWASETSFQQTLDKIRTSSHLFDAFKAEGSAADVRVSLERYILDNWSRLRSFEEFVLLFVNELKAWGLDIYRFSLAFLPDEDDIDCSQYIWVKSRPGEVKTLRMDRDFLEQEEHLRSPLHYIASSTKIFRQSPYLIRENSFPFLDSLKAEGCSDYLGIRMESRGISIPVLTIALNDGSVFSDEEVQRIEAMSSLLSLLFYAFESERSKRLAMLDPLTSLANRRSFDSFLKSNIAASRLAKSSLSLALIDVDQFKIVNDVFGHAYGDRCLKEIASALNSRLRRKNDFVARLGGEEFAIILPNSDAESSLQICEQLRQSIQAREIEHPGHEGGNHLTVSIGIAVWDPLVCQVCEADLLLQLADDCLYEAKRNGRNRVVCRSLLSSPSGPSA